MNISKFTSKFKDLARTNRYIVTIDGYLTEDTSVFCNSASLGGMTLTTTEQRGLSNSHYKVIPYDTIYESISLTFYNDIDFKVYKKFKEWYDLIYKSKSDEFSYRDTYVKTMNIAILDRQDTPALIYTFEEVFPLSIKEPDLKSTDTNAISTFSVTLDYNKRSIN